MLVRGEGRGQKVLAVAAVALTVVLVVAQLWTTDFGFGERVVDGSPSLRVVTDIDRAGAGERAGIAVGDAIVQDPGLDTYVAPWTEREVYGWTYRLGRALRAGHVPIRIRHDGVERDVVVVPDPAPNLPAALRQLRRMGTQLPTAFGFLGVAILLAFRRRSPRLDAPGSRARAHVARADEAADVVTVACSLLGPAFVVDWPMPAWPLWLYPVSSVVEVLGSAAGGALLAYFAWSYPTRSRIVDRTRVRGGVALFGASCTLFSILNSLHVVDAPPALHGNTANMVFGGATGIAIFAGLVWQRRRARDVIARRQTTWLLAFCAAGIFGPLLVLIVPQYAFGWATPLLHVVGLSFPVLIPIGFAAVVTRYRLFAVDGIALRAGPYAIALGTSVALAVAVSLVVEAAFAHRAGSAESGRWLGTIAALLLIEPVRRGSRVLIDRAFARDRDAFVARCAALATKLAGSAEIATIEAEVQATLDAKVAQLLPLSEILDEESATAITAQVARRGSLRVVDLARPAAVDALLARGLERLVLVPMNAPTPERSGLDVLGLTLPNDGQRMDRVEEDALALVGRVIGATLSRAIAERHLEREITRAEEERRQIAMELHDGIGATLTAARSMTRRLRRPAPESGETLDALDAALRDGLQDLRSSLWGLDPLEASWDALVARIRRQAEDQCAAEGIVLTVHAAGEVQGNTSPAGRLAILRVIQEAVNNAVKHGAPAHVDIRVDADADRIEVVVEDDGRGVADAPLGATASNLADTGGPPEHEARGLGNMARRIESLGGTFRFGRRERGGTRVALSLPIVSVAHTSSTIPAVGAEP